MLEMIKTKYLFNDRGKIEGQRFQESWFLRRGLQKEYNFLMELGIHSTRDLYDYENPDQNNGICKCGTQKKFRGYNKGYGRLCTRCNTLYHNTKEGTTYIELENVPSFVKNKNGGYTNNKMKKLSKKVIDNIIQRTSYLKNTSKEVTLTERIYHIEHGLTEPVKCKGCGGYNDNFLTSLKGYQDGCLINRCSQTVLVDFESRAKKQRSALYDDLYARYSELSNLDLNVDYKIIELTTRERYAKSKELLITIEHNCGHQYVRSHKFQGFWRCPKCFARKSENQHRIFLNIRDVLNIEPTDISSVIFDDRSVLCPLELDIYIPHKKIAIEYNGIMFHSFGSVKNPRSLEEYCENDEENRKDSHLNKTELCEEKGLQLFQIFSSEYNTIPEIWDSVIRNALGESKRVYARKTTVREVPSKEARLFQEENHLQGAINASVRLGLYLEDELVSLMTFGKSRYSKNVEYELLRFCNKLNTSVVGGASKLLKYFERNYKPRSIISYANRRWSTGKLYENLGFEFQHCTKPNYFYFRYNSDLLESRVKFQKHKLKDLLDNFDPDLTESENMYNNNYRKIYDCGNKVYIKRY